MKNKIHKHKFSKGKTISNKCFKCGFINKDEIGTFYGESIIRMSKENLLKVIRHLVSELEILKTREITPDEELHRLLS